MKLCALFEIDGVIVDTNSFHLASERMLLQLLGIPKFDEGQSVSLEYTAEKMWQEIRKQYNLPISIPEIIKLKETLYLEQLQRAVYIRSIPYVLTLISDLHKYRVTLAIASSLSLEAIDYILNDLCIKEYFHCIISGRDAGYIKSSEEIYLQVPTATGIAPESCIVMGCTADSIKAAKKANMKCIAYMGKNPSKQGLNGADLIISSFIEVSALSIKGMLWCPANKVEG